VGTIAQSVSETTPTAETTSPTIQFEMTGNAPDSGLYALTLDNVLGGKTIDPQYLAGDAGARAQELFAGGPGQITYEIFMDQLGALDPQLSGYESKVRSIFTGALSYLGNRKDFKDVEQLLVQQVHNAANAPHGGN
jgi:hypothetical protein